MIRPLVGSDRDAWEPLWQGYLTFYKSALSDAQTDLTWSRLIDDAVPINGLAVEHDGKVVGFAHILTHPSSWSRNGYAYLEDLFVDPAMRGQRYGKALIEAVYRFAEDRDLDRVHWVTASDNPARSLYDNVATLADFVQYRHDTGAAK